MMKIIIAIVIIIVIIILFIASNSSCSVDGVWCGESEYLESAELKELIIVFKDNELAITAFNKEGIEIENSLTSYSISKSFISACLFENVFILETENPTMFPKILTMKLVKDKGIMILYNEEELYATLIKNNELSILI